MAIFGVVVILCILQWNEIAATMPPTNGECTESFIEVYPPQIMDTWYVMMHTDSLTVAPMPDCLIVKFGRRMSFNSEIRIDIIYMKEDASEVSLPFLRGEVTVPGGEPFGVKMSLSPVFPKNIMISDFDEDNKCLAFWSCADLGSSTIQKGAWLMCQSPDLDQEVIVNMAEKIANASDIELSDFIWTEYETCL